MSRQSCRDKSLSSSTPRINTYLPMPATKRPLTFTFSNPAKKLKQDPNPFTQQGILDVVPEIFPFLGLKDQVAFGSTCKSLRDYAPKKLTLGTLDLGRKVNKDDVLEIHLDEFYGKSIEEHAKMFGNYQKIKHLRVSAAGIDGETAEELEKLTYAPCEIRDFFVELDILVFVDYKICFDLNIDFENFENLKMFRILNGIYNGKSTITISNPLQDIALYFLEDPTVKLNLGKATENNLKIMHGNCRVHLEGELKNPYKQLCPGKSSKVPRDSYAPYF